MDQIFIVTANNGASYEDYEIWDCYFSEDSKQDLEKRIKYLNDQIWQLFEKAEEFYRKKLEANPSDYYLSWYETAPGKRYIKFLLENKLITKEQTGYMHSRVTVSFHPLERGPNLV